MTLVDRYSGKPLDADSHVGFYGPGQVVHAEPNPEDDLDDGYGIVYRQGVLAEHVESFVAAGGKVKPAASGSGLVFAILSDGRAVPVVCGDLIPIRTEDGPSDGRCGADATDDGMCAGHAADYRAFLAREPQYA